MMDALQKQAVSTADMIRIPGGTFRMGSDRHYPEEAPVLEETLEDIKRRRSPGGG